SRPGGTVGLPFRELPTIRTALELQVRACLARHRHKDAAGVLPLVAHVHGITLFLSCDTSSKVTVRVRPKGPDFLLRVSIDKMNNSLDRSAGSLDMHVTMEVVGQDM